MTEQQKAEAQKIQAAIQECMARLGVHTWGIGFRFENREPPDWWPGMHREGHLTFTIEFAPQPPDGHYLATGDDIKLAAKNSARAAVG